MSRALHFADEDELAVARTALGVFAMTMARPKVLEALFAELQARADAPGDEQALAAIIEVLGDESTGQWWGETAAILVARIDAQEAP